MMRGREPGKTVSMAPPAKGTKKVTTQVGPKRAQAAGTGLANPSLVKRSSLVGSRNMMMESKSRLHAASRGPKRKDDDAFRDYEDMEGDGDWSGGPKELVPPPDQLTLTDQEMKEELTRVLNAKNPHAPPNIIQFSHKEKIFKQIPSIEQTVIHFSLDSNLIYKDSDEAQRQLNRQKGETSADEDSEEEEEEQEEEEEEEGEKEEVAEGEEKEVEEEQEQKKAKEGKKKKKGSESTGGEKQLRNQFNFSERASQTLNNPCRDRETATEPPPRVDFSATANQMEIFDAYVEDLIKQDKAKEKKGSSKPAGGHEEEAKKPVTVMQEDISRVARPMMIMERMVNQNTFDEIAQDFKYYNDPADEYKDKGSLLPLWRFRYEQARKMGVTTLCWNPLYNDLFAVGHGSYDFSGQGSGLICFYSLKNPSYPAFTFPVSCGVMCLDSHSEHPYLLAAGMYDGSVAIYDLREGTNNPIYQATAKSGKHTDPVWQVCWQQNDMDGNINFSSVSSDGRVVTWKLVKNELQFVETVKLNIPDTTVAGPEGTQDAAISSGTAIGFNPMEEHLFLVGSEDGRIYKCSKAYTSQFLQVYQAHHMAVHGIHWNPFHSSVFASCGADWTVKIWDHNRPEPMFSFDLNSVVSCVAWSPYASTVFAAATADGRVFVFDLAINKYEPLATQSVIQKKRTKLTHVSFNPVHPILIAGDDRGSVVCLKLSPNLRKAQKEKNYSRENEIAKMDKLISFVREPLLENTSKTPAAV